MKFNMSLFVVMMVVFNVSAEPLQEYPSNLTINSGSIPEYSKEFIQSKDFYTHAIGTLEKDGVQGSYGFVTVDEMYGRMSHFYMFFENKSDAWVKVGFSIKKDDKSSKEGPFDPRYLFTPIPPSGSRKVLSSSATGRHASFKDNKTYSISIYVEKLLSVLQIYLDMKYKGLVHEVYKKSGVLLAEERDKLLNVLNLDNKVGFSFDSMTKMACGDRPVTSIEEYKLSKDNIYIYSSSCTLWGGGVPRGKEYVSIFRFNGTNKEVLFHSNTGPSAETGGVGSFFDVNGQGNLYISDLDRDGNIEILLNVSTGYDSEEVLYEIVDGKLEKLLVENVYSEGEAFNAAECPAGEPFQNCTF